MPESGGERLLAEEAPDCAAAGDGLRPRITADGSPSLWSEHFAEGFHSGAGAMGEARLKFVAPAQLERFAPGTRLRVVEVGVGLAYNTAALLEAAQQRGLTLQWWGLEIDPRPLALALQEASFRQLWQSGTVARLEHLADHGSWAAPPGEGRWLLGDARRRLPELLAAIGGRCDLVLHDAFSPRRCPQLWSLEFLSALAQLLSPEGRLLTYCSAAAVRQALRLAGLELASLQEDSGASAERIQRPVSRFPSGRSQPSGPWSLGTVASPSPLPSGGPLRSLGPMEWEHLATRAAEPYRDPSGQGEAAALLAAREQAQRISRAGSSSAWRRRWADHLGIRTGASARETASAPSPAPAARPAAVATPGNGPAPKHPPG